jgi:putative restriction endonuclease
MESLKAYLVTVVTRPPSQRLCCQSRTEEAPGRTDVSPFIRLNLVESSTMLRAVGVGSDLDDRLRSAAFAYLDTLLGSTGGRVSRRDLRAFSFEGHRIPLISPQTGIWKPAALDAALSILTTYVRPGEVPPYEDNIGDDWYARYKWRGTDRQHSDNRALRTAMSLKKPLMWFLGVAPGIYRAEYPVWLVDEEPEAHQFVVALDQSMRTGWSRSLIFEPFNPGRRYAETTVRARLHQRPFRDRVLLAYHSQCALCRLRHEPLLDAAHIKEDADGGEPIVPNGMAMCAIHHRAFDAHVLGVTPKYRVEVRPDVLREHDGPTLQHALQGLHGERITLPRHRAEWPSPLLLEERFERFLQRAG